jgi:hypothetical protein
LPEQQDGTVFQSWRAPGVISKIGMPKLHSTTHYTSFKVHPIGPMTNLDSHESELASVLMDRGSHNQMSQTPPIQTS